MTKTPLVIGAGASQEVGLPTGKQLTETIASKLNIKFEFYKQTSGDHQIVQALQHQMRASGGSENIDRYIWASGRICSAMPQAASIDRFIDDHRGDKEIEVCGKLAITQAILEAEKGSLMSVGPQSQPRSINFDNIKKKWFNKFWSLITAPKDSAVDEMKKISFIVFNYDRCLEYFLFHALQNYYGFSDDIAAACVNSLEIYHPYGTVGHLPWQKGPNTVDFGATATPIELASLSTQIKTFTERVEDTSTVDAMHEAVRSAETIVFLGFAFHQQNVDLIKPGGETAAKQAFSTTKGVSDSGIPVVRQQMFDLFEKRKGGLEVGLKIDKTCSGLFEEYGRSLTLS